MKVSSLPLIRPQARLLLLPALLAMILGGCATQDFVQQEVGQFDQRIRNLESWLSTVTQGIDANASRVREAEGRIGRVEQSGASLAVGVEETRAGLDGARQRLDRLAADLTAANQRIEAGNAETARTNQRLDGLESRVNATSRRVEGAVAGLALAEGRISVLESSAIKAPPSAGPGKIEGGDAAASPVASAPLPTMLAPTMPTASQATQAQEAALKATNERIGELQSELAHVRQKTDVNAEILSRIDKRISGMDAGLDAAQKRVEAGEKVLAESGVRLTMVQELLKGHSERLSRSEIEQGRVSTTALEALERARSAGKLAEGKLVFETSLTDEVANFGFGNARLSDAARRQLSDFANRLMAENRGVFIEIQGHTDNTGPAEVNLRLSLARAQAVLDYLHQEAGIPLHRLAVMPYGETMPVADNKTREGRGKNRRVVLVVLK